MTRGPDSTALLQRALAASASTYGVAVTFGRMGATPWESATFSGARHVIEARVAGEEAADAWVNALPEVDLPLHGHLVADLSVTGVTQGGAERSFTIEALTVVCS